MSIFSDKKIQALEVKTTKYTVTESTGERGEGRLQVNVYPSGVKKFQIQYFLQGKRKRFEFGRYGKQLGYYSLSQARVKFSELSAVLKQGADPKQGVAEVNKDGIATVGELREGFLTWYELNRKVSSHTNVKNLLEKNFEIDDNLLARDVTEHHVQSSVYGIWNERSKSQANALKNAISGMFKYAIEYDNSPERYGKKPRYDITTNPCLKVFLHYKANKGKRYLTEDEICNIWHVKNMSVELHNYIKLALVLAGQRIDEVSLSNDSEFNLSERTFEVPAERVKITERGAHIVPLSDFALSVIKDIRKSRHKNGSMIGDGTKNNKSLGGSLRWWFVNNPDFEKFTLRDLRRTCKTLMTKAGVPIEHRDMLQQHHKSDVATVHYDRYNYMKEKRIAMDIWGDYLHNIIKD